MMKNIQVIKYASKLSVLILGFGQKRLEFVEKSMTGKKVAREIINVLAVSLGIQPHLLFAAMRDCTSVNSVTMRTVGVILPHVLDVRCFSHTLYLVGDRFETPTLSNFISHWVSLFSHSPKTSALWKEQTGTSMKMFSKTRWWSKWEVIIWNNCNKTKILDHH